MKRRLVLIGGGIALLLALVGGFRLVRGLSFFDVRRVELAGGIFLTPESVARVIAVPAGTSIFDSPARYLRKVRALPGVLEASVSRRLPGTLRFTIRESRVVALAPSGGKLVPLDESGRALPFDPTRPAMDLPIAEVDSAVAGVLALVRDARPDLYRRIERGTRVRQDVVLEIAGGRLLFRGDATVEEVHDLALIEELLTRRGEKWKELDARFASRVVVRGMSA